MSSAALAGAGAGRCRSEVALRLSVALDTETTGLDPLDGHRVVEIGTVELINRSQTGNTFHRYLCPERDIPADAPTRLAHAIVDAGRD